MNTVLYTPPTSQLITDMRALRVDSEIFDVHLSNFQTSLNLQVFVMSTKFHNLPLFSPQPRIKYQQLSFSTNDKDGNRMKFEKN